VLPILENS